MEHTQYRTEKCFFFFDSFSLDGLKEFIIQDDKKTIDKILVGIEQIKRNDQKLTLCKIKFNLGACKYLSKKKKKIHLVIPLETFFFVQGFGIKLKLKSFVNTWMLEDRVQDLDSSTCGIFQLYFYENLFNPDQNSKI